MFTIVTVQGFVGTTPRLFGEFKTPSEASELLVTKGWSLTSTNTWKKRNKEVIIKKPSSDLSEL